MRVLLAIAFVALIGCPDKPDDPPPSCGESDCTEIEFVLDGVVVFRRWAPTFVCDDPGLVPGHSCGDDSHCEDGARCIENPGLEGRYWSAGPGRCAESSPDQLVGLQCVVDAECGPVGSPGNCLRRSPGDALGAGG